MIRPVTRRGRGLGSAGLAFSALLLLGLCLACQEDISQEEMAWTTSSEEARDRFVEGFEAWSKAYHNDALRHFEAALELDPDFIMARLFLAFCQPLDHPERMARLEALAAEDLSRLNPRERFMVRYDLSRSGLLDQDPGQILDQFLDDFPKDPFGQRTRCEVAWEEQDWEVAEGCYQDLLKLYPNMVDAQNRLGFIAMAQGRFSEAEEHFINYRYLAPDQALPYQSLGELLTVLGRYDEADEALNRALELKGDFCEARRVRVKWRVFSGRLEEGRQLLEQMREDPSCAMYQKFGFYCTMDAWIHFQSGDVEAAWEAMEGECLESRHGFDLMAHRVALASGRLAESEAMEEALHDYFELLSTADLPVLTAYYAAIQQHMEGTRLLWMGDAAAAAERFQAVDDRLGYWGGDRAGFKLFNRWNWMQALEALGKDARVEALRHKIEAINPRYLEDLLVPQLAPDHQDEEEP